MLDEGETLAEGTSGLAIRVTAISPQAGAATVSVCRKAAGAKETQQTCRAGKDGDCDGLVGGADTDCWAYVPRPPSKHPPPPVPPLRGTLLSPGPNSALTMPPNAAKQCLLGNAFCTDVAKAAMQVRGRRGLVSRLVGERGVPACSRCSSGAHVFQARPLGAACTRPPPPGCRPGQGRTSL